MLNKLFGTSIYLLVLDLFLDNPEKFMNLREIARRVDKNPGSISRVIPRLLEEELLKKVEVGKVMYAYHLNREDDLVQLLIDFRKRLEKLYKDKFNE
jgi:DNA-binding transcriptional ArsR family regulator